MLNSDIRPVHIPRHTPLTNRIVALWRRVMEYIHICFYTTTMQSSSRLSLQQLDSDLANWLREFSRCPSHRNHAFSCFCTSTSFTVSLDSCHLLLSFYLFIFVGGKLSLFKDAPKVGDSDIFEILFAVIECPYCGRSSSVPC